MRKYKHIKNQVRYTRGKATRSCWSCKKAIDCMAYRFSSDSSRSYHEKEETICFKTTNGCSVDQPNFSLLETKEPHYLYSLHTYFLLEPFVSIKIAIVTCSSPYDNDPKRFINREATEAWIYPGIGGDLRIINFELMFIHS